jgi:hypothetical protein
MLLAMANLPVRSKRTCYVLHIPRISGAAMVLPWCCLQVDKEMPLLLAILTDLACCVVAITASRFAAMRVPAG